jgi:cobalamin 5'-phosphate synthase/cobalamin synthase
MRAAVLGPVAALQFLSVIPVRLPAPVPAATFPNAVVWFPLVGALLGALVAAADALLGGVLSPTVVSAIDLVLLALVTGGLHLDGLADAADGLVGNMPRERRLDVMRDGGIGAFGAATLALTLLVEYGALLALPSGTRSTAIVVTVAVSRWAMSLMLGAFPYARTAGSGSVFRSGLRPSHVIGAAALGLLIAGVGASWIGIVLVGVSVLVALLIGSLAVRRIGGCTGDVYGAGGELTFAAALVVLSGLAR